MKTVGIRTVQVLRSEEFIHIHQERKTHSTPKRGVGLVCAAVEASSSNVHCFRKGLALIHQHLAGLCEVSLASIKSGSLILEFP